MQNTDIYAFALFGVKVNNQIVIESSINATLQFDVVIGALLCIFCDVSLYNSSFVFIATGQKLSGIVLETNYTIQIYSSTLQFRLFSLHTSGIVNYISSTINFTINDCKLTGYNIIYSNYSGYIAAYVSIALYIEITDFKVCVDNINRFGNLSAQCAVSETETIKCDICGTSEVVYGLCLDELIFGQIVNGMLQCVYPFEYLDNQCVCSQGYLLNQSQCINVIDAISNNENSVYENRLLSIEQNTNTINNQLQTIDQNIQNNIDIINNTISSNFYLLEQYILQNFTQSDINLLTNTTILDMWISNNVTALNYSILNNITALNQRIISQNSVISQQDATIQQFIQILNCTSRYGYQMIDNTCTKVNCSIYGQQSIDGVCQCSIINAVVENNTCICPNSQVIVGNVCQCPINSEMIANECVCNVIPNQIMVSGVCVCQTTGAFLVSGACSCGLHSLNNSNVCGCPTGATLQSQVCTCTNINAYISGSSCICPTNSTLLGNVCICPYYSQIVNHICQCPLNSEIIVNQCVCNISGQSMINGSCQCQQGQSVINGTCQNSYVINNSDNSLICLQFMYIQTFEITSITFNVSNSVNFSNGYVFNTASFIINAFIDVSDLIYSSTVQPLFQTQSTFNNIKLQIGTQSVNSGAIISNLNSIVINQMNIISKIGTQIIVNAGYQLNIVQNTIQSASITNLMINLTFAMSQGNITLFNSITSEINISNYQILGCYLSTKSVTMIGLSILQAQIKLNNLTFMPTHYNVGNFSSYFLSNVTQCTVYLNQIVIVMGNSSNYLTTNSIASDVNNKFYFGGLITKINSSIIQVIQIIYNSYASYYTNYLHYSGLLIGNSSGSNNVQISSVCLQQTIISSTTSFIFFGIVGYFDGNISFLQSQVNLTVQGNYFCGMSIVGQLTPDCIFSEFINIKSTVNYSATNTSSYAYISGLVGHSQSHENSLIKNSVVNQSNIAGAQYFIGGFQSYVYNGSITFINTTVQNSNITSTGSYIGGYVGRAQNSQIIMTNAKILYSKIHGGSNWGIVLGYNDNSTLNINNSSSFNNYRNTSLQPNCLSFVNMWSVLQC
ncbi:Conserved_hypothetical protein [Hexamita inflata]|uniref:Uncharacterized protein n=1 Tax=Hexamita inflata TaxID=28002 RepID=A0ABP1HK36_9EUKA